MASKAELKILAAAEEVFGNVGYFGATLRDLGRKSGVAAGSIYRLFEGKEQAFARAVGNARERAGDPAKLLLLVFDHEERSGKQDFESILAEVLRRWYHSVSQKSARLLTQAYFVQPNLRFMAGTPSPYAPFDQMIKIIATVIAGQQKLHSEKGATVAATAIILALLHFKITGAAACSPKQEAETVNSFIQLWLQGLSPAV